MIKSPGSIAHFTPSTVVKAPRPWTTRRSAAGVWWWLGGGLAGQDDLQPRKQGRGNSVRPSEAGVLQDENSPLCLLDGDEPRRFEQERPEVPPPPPVRHRGGHPLVRQEDVERGPERSEGERFQRLAVRGWQAGVACRQHRRSDDTRQCRLPRPALELYSGGPRKELPMAETRDRKSVV